MTKLIRTMVDMFIMDSQAISRVSSAVRTFAGAIHRPCTVKQASQAIDRYASVLRSHGASVGRAKTLAHCFSRVPTHVLLNECTRGGIVAGLRQHRLYPSIQQSAPEFAERLLMSAESPYAQGAQAAFVMLQSMISSATNRLVGKGRQATVILGNEVLWGDSAVKRYPWERYGRCRAESSVFYAMNELRLLAEPPPGAIRIHDVRVTNRHIELVMSRMEEGTVLEWAKRIRQEGDVEPGDAWIRYLEMMRASAIALQGIHHSNILHRDVKLENMLIGGAHVLYGDFAGSIRKGESNYLDAFAGDQQFAAPEVILEGNYSERSEIYALAANWLVMLYGGHVPGAMRIIPSALRADLPIPVAFDLLIEQMMSENPEGRPQNLSSVIVALDTMLPNPA